MNFELWRILEESFCGDTNKQRAKRGFDQQAANPGVGTLQFR